MAATVPSGPAQVNITGVRAGDRNEMAFTLTSNGSPIDLTDTVLNAQARAKATDEPAAITAVITITDAAAGKGTMRWPGDQVRALLGTQSAWSGVWDFQLGEDDDATTIAGGAFGAVLDVTRD